MSAQLDHRLARAYPEWQGLGLARSVLFASSQRSARSHASALMMRRSVKISFSAPF